MVQTGRRCSTEKHYKMKAIEKKTSKRRHKMRWEGQIFKYKKSGNKGIEEENDRQGM